ncbi:uncharacterized protein DMAD_02820 [Drosophila madeirensis]
MGTDSDYDFSGNEPCQSASCETPPPTSEWTDLSWLCLIENGHVKCYSYHYDANKEISVEEVESITVRRRTGASHRTRRGKGERSRKRLNRRSKHKIRRRNHKLARLRRRHGFSSNKAKPGIRRSKGKRT